MNNPLVFIVVTLVSLALGLIKYGSLADQYKDKSWQSKFNEGWNDFINYFIAGLIVYYFIVIKWPLLQKGEALYVGDLILFIIFALGSFGHLCIISKNITDGVEAILKKVLGKD